MTGRDADGRVREAASMLLGAYGGTPVQPLTATFEGLTVREAYDVQRVQVEAWTADGASVRGHKVGLTSVAMQRMLGVGEPDFGHVMDWMVHPDAAVLPADAYLQPRIEPELAFILGAPLKGPGVTLAEAAAATRYLVPALEIIDSRIADWKISLVDTIADNASSGGVVLGCSFVPLSRIDGRLTGCNLFRNGAVAATGATGAVLGHPLLAVQWLANTLGERGTALEEGHIVLSGSCTAALPVVPGDTFTSVFAGLGSVTTTFGAVGSPR